MSKSVNSVTILGNCGKDPILKATGSGTAVANFSVATSDRRKDAQGNWQDEVCWHEMVAFGRTAEIVRDYVRKGTKIYVEGRINNRQYEKDGQKHYSSEIVINELVLLDGGGKREEPQQQNNSVELSDDDIPF